MTTQTKKITASALAACMVISHAITAQNTYAVTLPTGGTGLDQIVTLVNTDPGLKKRLTIKDPTKRILQSDIDTGAKAADDMNKIIIEKIKERGLANDGRINTADARDLNDAIYKSYATQWKALHGDDANGVETGYHLVQNDGATTKWFNKNAVDKVADGIYHLGFESSRKNRLLNEDGNDNATYKNVGEWLTSLLQKDLANGSLKNPSVIDMTGTTNSGLDRIVKIVLEEERLNTKISTSEIRTGAKAADDMNKIILEAVNATGVFQDRFISASDARKLNTYINGKYADTWKTLHGDDATGAETGFHLVQNDGAKAKLYGKNAVNTVADGIYHLGFGAGSKNQILNEDGNKNATFKNVGIWLTRLLNNDFDIEE